MTFSPVATGSALFDTNRLSANLQENAKAGDPKALKVVAQQFEAFFLKQVLQEMRNSSLSTGLMGDEQSGALGEYNHWMDMQMADTLSQRGIGLSDALLRQWMEGSRKPVANASPSLATDPSSTSKNQ